NREWSQSECDSRIRDAGDICRVQRWSVKAYFGRRYMLSASHRLHCAELTTEQNRAAYGKCNNPHGHGHNYTIEVLAGGEVEQATGMVINLVDLDQTVRMLVLDRFDHVNLNLDPLFVSLVPTTENFGQAIFNLLYK